MKMKLFITLITVLTMTITASAEPVALNIRIENSAGSIHYSFGGLKTDDYSGFSNHLDEQLTQCTKQLVSKMGPDTVLCLWLRFGGDIELNEVVRLRDTLSPHGYDNFTIIAPHSNPETIILATKGKPTEAMLNSSRVMRKIDWDSARTERCEQAQVIRSGETGVETDKDRADLDSVQFLGMTVMNPTDEMITKYDLSGQGPVITSLTEKAQSYWRHAPGEGCAFWIVSHPAHALLFNEEQSPCQYPETVRQLLEAILACAVSPEDYRQILNERGERCRKRAEALKDSTTEQDRLLRDRLLKVAEAGIPEQDQEMYICRVVYRYPGKKGTMTTFLRMTDHDYNRLRELLLK